ncbi:gamma carbonic anhydrase family protein [Planctopirus hydrillae]|uniref:Gamma carbonic anhydrase family protein n=1 Tax=Planctopirus hydrillae TaxID=1841610 RepID=A0A1C3E5S0_9PLAN|nr:gamma carbonic anhydrase family protein [Planctopirus hydrillae]ODA28587.1 gamma carbonic anhydrase family protein [Planctopirus hydrillae]
MFQPPEVPFPQIHWDFSAITENPEIDPTAWIAPGATLYGRVSVGARSSIWFGAVVRGDHERIDIGEDSNLQDGAILHVDPHSPCKIGNRVSLGHRALVHGATVEDDVLIGISANVLSRAVIGRGAFIAAGALVLEETIVPPGTLWAGVPARQIREVSPELAWRTERTWKHYANNSVAHRAAQKQGIRFTQ